MKEWKLKKKKNENENDDIIRFGFEEEESALSACKGERVRPHS